MENFTYPTIRHLLTCPLRLAVIFCTMILTSVSIEAHEISYNIIYTDTDTDTDTDGDSVPDKTDIDDDDDGIIDSNEDANDDGDNDHTTNPTDTDNDGVPNYLDIDSDNDGILDNVEAQTVASFQAPSGIDSDGNGLDDQYEETPGSYGGLIPVDTDEDSIPDNLDIDSDNDGILDKNESSIIKTDFDCNSVPKLAFTSSPVLEFGQELSEGAIYRIEQVTNGVDALITIDKINNARIEVLDQNAIDPEFFKPEIEFTTTDEVKMPYVDLRISLVFEGSSQPFVLNELIANFIDVDGNQQYQEFNRFDTPASYTVDEPKEITVNNTSGGLLVNGGFQEYEGIFNTHPSVNVAVEFIDISTFVFRFGIQTQDSNNFTTIVRQSGIQFSCLANFVNPQTITFSIDRNSDNDDFPDRVDIDSDNDGIPDNIEGQSTEGYITPTGADDDNDGLDNAYEGTGDEGLTPVNTDGTDAPDYLDDDTDNDLVPDNNEGNDFNFDGIPDQLLTGTDSDGDGLDDGYEGSDVNDGFDVNDEINDPANDLPDTDGTEDVNYRDLDDDGDGIDTPDEDADGDNDPTNDDTDDDGTPDYLDPISPNVVDDMASTEEDTPVEVAILDNDTGIPDNGILTTTDSENGMVVINDGGTPDDVRDDTVTYTPDSGFNNGTDIFEYTVCDAMENCDTATVTITVGTPPMPAAVDDMASTDEDIPVEVAILDNDTGISDNGILTTTDPENGTVVINDGGTPDDVRDDTVTYTPDSGFNGMDIFEYSVCDAMENCDTAIVQVEVKEVEVPIEVNQMVTPNGDGKNDFLFIRGVENARNNTIKIFNRWGVAVYEGFDYNNQNNVFDGRSKGRSTVSVQEYLPSGVYFYIFEYQKNSQNNITDSGYIYISK